MGVILETMSAFTTILRGSRQANYQTLPTSDDDRPNSSVGGQEGFKKHHEPAVYLAFWLFGAGTLLGWSGM